MKGICGYGRYDDDAGYVGCPRAKSDMSPCIARDGHLALAGSPESGRRDCVGCGRTPASLLTELAQVYPPAAHTEGSPDPEMVADRLTELVRAATEPVL